MSAKHTSVRLDEQETALLEQLMTLLGLSASRVLRLTLRRLFTITMSEAGR